MASDNSTSASALVNPEITESREETRSHEAVRGLDVLNGCSTIQLTKGLNTLVDECDYVWLSQRKWTANVCGRNRYAFRHDKSREKKTVLMHREILGASPGIQVDHKSRDKLDNRRENLRLATQRNNSANIGKFATNSTSSYKGVYWSRGHGVWYASIISGGQNHHLGTFDDETDAAYAYDRAARELNGEFAFTNFAEDDPGRGKRRDRRRSAY